jgi:hypothetical protein
MTSEAGCGMSGERVDQFGRVYKTGVCVFCGEDCSNPVPNTDWTYGVPLCQDCEVYAEDEDEEGEEEV